MATMMTTRDVDAAILGFLLRQYGRDQGLSQRQVAKNVAQHAFIRERLHDRSKRDAAEFATDVRERVGQLLATPERVVA